MELEQVRQLLYCNCLVAEKICKHFFVLNSMFIRCNSLNFNYCKCRTNASPEENIAELKNDALAFLIVSILESLILLFVGAICVDCFNNSAISQVTRMRVKYFTSLMRQDMGWFDVEKSKSNFAVRLDEYVSA